MRSYGTYRLLSAVLCGLALPLSTPAWTQSQPDVQSGCIVERVNLCDGCVHTRRAVVRKNAACAFEMSGGALGDADARITVRPRNGVLGKAAGSALAYRPKPNFIGEDEFEILGSWERMGRKMSITVRTKVTVVDGALRW
jgi:hypothetical protein